MLPTIQATTMISTRRLRRVMGRTLRDRGPRTFGRGIAARSAGWEALGAESGDHDDALVGQDPVMASVEHHPFDPAEEMLTPTKKWIVADAGSVLRDHEGGGAVVPPCGLVPCGRRPAHTYHPIQPVGGIRTQPPVADHPLHRREHCVDRPSLPIEPAAVLALEGAP